MNNYLAAARAHADDAAQCSFGSATQATHLALAQTCATLAIATALPQGTKETPRETTGSVRTTSSPAETSLVSVDHAEAEAEAIRALRRWREVDRNYPPDGPEAWPALLRLRDAADRLSGFDTIYEVLPFAGTPSLVMLDAADEVLAAARHVRALWVHDAFQQSIAWWRALGVLLRAVDAMEAGR